MNPVHIGKKKWWDGTVKTLCGITFKPGNHKYEFFSSATCPACKDLYRRGMRIK